jgi:hypothetical protein
MSGTSYRDFVMAMDRVEKRLLKVTKALDDAGVPYAVVGGNAVAAWVARVDPAATRTTKDVDLLIDQRDLSNVSTVMRNIGFLREEILGVVMFIDPEEPGVRGGVHIVPAGERVRPEYDTPAPSVEESEVGPQGYRVVSLPALVRMKLTSNRRIDQVHIEDLLRVGLIDDALRATLTSELRKRLASIESDL